MDKSIKRKYKKRDKKFIGAVVGAVTSAATAIAGAGSANKEAAADALDQAEDYDYQTSQQEIIAEQNAKSQADQDWADEISKAQALQQGYLSKDIENQVKSKVAVRMGGVKKRNKKFLGSESFGDFATELGSSVASGAINIAGAVKGENWSGVASGVGDAINSVGGGITENKESVADKVKTNAEEIKSPTARYGKRKKALFGINKKSKDALNEAEATLEESKQAFQDLSLENSAFQLESDDPYSVTGKTELVQPEYKFGGKRKSKKDKSASEYKPRKSKK